MTYLLSNDCAGRFFGFIGLALVLLIVTNIFATKFLHGDFLKPPPDEEEDEPVCIVYETSEEKQCSEGTGVEASNPEITPYELLSERSALIRIKVEGFTNTFASNAKVRLRFEYHKKLSIIRGTVLSIDGLCLEDEAACPDLISFRIKITPYPRKTKIKTSTMWKNANTRALALQYMLGPLKTVTDPKSQICVKLFGKKKTFAAKAKCYGECFVPFSSVMKADGVLDLHRHVLPPEATPTTTTPTATSIASTEHQRAFSTDDSERE